jgi:hypothetical protein
MQKGYSRIKSVRAALFFFLLMIYSPHVSAYIDPGTGGMVLGSAWTWIVGLIAAASGIASAYLLKPISKWIKSLFRHHEKK